MGRYDDIIGLSRPKSKRPKMSLSDRAKIFSPFAALRGYDDAVSAKRIFYSERKILSDDAAEAINRTLKELRAGDTVEIIYFTKIRESSGVEYGRYDAVRGEFGGTDNITGHIIIGGNTVNTNDIIEIVIGD